MQYDYYLAKGFPIATGVVEGACLHYIKDRMERTGARWTIPGAQAMLEMRATYLNNDWDIFQSYRILKERQKLYPYHDGSLKRATVTTNIVKHAPITN